VHGEGERSGGALAPRATGSSLAEGPPELTGGAGLFDHSARDPFGATAGRWAGVLGLVIVLVTAGALVVANPSLESGKAGGTADQLGQPAASAAGPEVAPGSPAAEGRDVLASKPCGSCHTIPGIQGATATVGPNLAGVASRTSIAGGAVPNSGPDDLKKWIMNPPAVKPGTAMPNYNLTDDEATKIVAYLETLK
jgi:cytochrome c2